MEQTDDAVQDELEQLAHGAIGEELHGQRIEDARPLGAALLLVHGDSDALGVRVAVDGDQFR